LSPAAFHIGFIPGNDPEQPFQKWEESDHPYDHWFKQQLGSFYGLDFNQSSPGTLPKQLFEMTPTSERTVHDE
jgi:hypothetical protein